MTRPAPGVRADYRHFLPVTTRWMDNDVFGHVNNVTYYSYFDTVVNRYLIEAGVLDVAQGAVIGLVVETHCNYFAPLSFPQVVDAGLRVAQIGASSVRYEIGLFAAGEPLDEPGGFRSLLNSFLPRKRAIGQMLIRDTEGRVLLCQLTYKKDWDLPGGVVEVGESPRVAVGREVEEELGLTIPAGACSPATRPRSGRSARTRFEGDEKFARAVNHLPFARPADRDEPAHPGAISLCGA